MKKAIHPSYQPATIECACGNISADLLDARLVQGGDLLRLPSLLHRQAEAGRLRRPHRALQPEVRPRAKARSGTSESCRGDGRPPLAATLLPAPR